jgi:hypothetical protein
MFAIPSLEDVKLTAEGLGMHLSPDEVLLFHEPGVALAGLDDFVQARLHEGEPEVLFPARQPGI